MRTESRIYTALRFFAERQLFSLCEICCRTCPFFHFQTLSDTPRFTSEFKMERFAEIIKELNAAMEKAVQVCKSGTANYYDQILLQAVYRVDLCRVDVNPDLWKDYNQVIRDSHDKEAARFLKDDIQMALKKRREAECREQQEFLANLHSTKCQLCHGSSPSWDCPGHAGLYDGWIDGYLKQYIDPQLPPQAQVEK